MRILGFLPRSGGAPAELLRATRILELDYDLAHSERQVLRLAEQSTDSNRPTLVVTTDEEIKLLRELQARTPRCRILLLTKKKFVDLPNFVSLNKQIDGYVLAQNYFMSTRFFLSFLSQQIATSPFALRELMGPSVQVAQFRSLMSSDKADLLRKADSFFLWCLGDNSDQGNIEKSRQLSDTLDELLTNTFRHGGKSKKNQEVLLTDVDLAFDGTLIGIRVADGTGSLERQRILESLATNHTLIHSSDDAPLPHGGMGLKMILEKQQRVIFHLHEGVSTEVICLSRLPLRHREAATLPTALEIRNWRKAR